MDLELTRIDYGNIGPNALHCLKLLPNDNHRQQKIVVGNLDGNLRLFSIKKSEAQIHFQIFVGKKISCMQLGGAPGTAMDKIFLASENIVKAYNKKGKMFLSFDTNLTEPIKCMFVSGSDLLICGNHVYNHYRDCKDIGTYLCGDTIVDVIAVCPHNTNRIMTILACSGRVLRILEHCRVRLTVELDSVPTTLHVPRNVLGDRVLCGFENGKVSMFYFGHFSGEVKQKILIKPDASKSAITCMDTFDMSGEGREDLLIGRSDGTVEVFSMPLDDDIDIEPKILYHECFSEFISAIQGGRAYSTAFSEILILTYAGSVFGLTTQVISVSLTDKEIIRGRLENNRSTTTGEGIEAIVDDISTLSLVKPQENYKLSTQILTPGVSAVNLFDITDLLILQKENIQYYLSIEMPVPICEIVFQSECFIKMLEPKNGVAVFTENKVDQSSGYQYSGKAQLKAGKHRMETRFQTVEGKYGNLEAYIMPDIEPICVQVKTYLIRPLSLHTRIHTFDSQRPLNILTLKGLFTQAEIHNWIEHSIPEVPERVPLGETAQLYFENALIGTILECKYEYYILNLIKYDYHLQKAHCRKGNAQFKSDNISTISILKDFLTKEATKKRIMLEISCEIAEQTIPYVLKLVEPKILECNKMKTEYKLLQALLQVDIRNDEDFNCLMLEYRSILNRRKEIEENFEIAPEDLTTFFGLLTDLYIDRFKFKGIFVKDRIPELTRLLDNYEYDEVLEYFNTLKSNEVNSQVI